MRISDRLSAIKNYVNRGEIVADIGTDHGYVPMLLYKENVSPKVIMSDISEASLAKAFNNFRQAHLLIEPDNFRTGFGIETLEAGEVDAVIIAGLGANTILQILEHDLAKTRSFRKFILQPRKHSGVLRYWLYQNDFTIVDESLAREGKFACEIIVAISSILPENKQPDFEPNDIRWAYPPDFKEFQNRKSKEKQLYNNKLWSSRVCWKLNSIQQQIDNLHASSTQNEDLINKLLRDMEYLNTVL